MFLSIPALIWCGWALFQIGNQVYVSAQALGHPYQVTEGRQFDWLWTLAFVGGQFGLLWWGGFFEIKPYYWTVMA